MWWIRTLSVEKVGVLGLWGTFDKAALEMVAYKDFTESRKLAFGPPALFEFDALISEAAPLDVSLKWNEENMIYWTLLALFLPLLISIYHPRAIITLKNKEMVLKMR